MEEPGPSCTHRLTFERIDFPQPSTPPGERFFVSNPGPIAGAEDPEAILGTTFQKPESRDDQKLKVRFSTNNIYIHILIHYTPWKINGWNLKITYIVEKENHLNQASIFGFRVIIFRVYYEKKHKKSLYFLNFNAPKKLGAKKKTDQIMRKLGSF